MKSDIPWSFTNQKYKGHEIQIDYFESQAWVWIDGRKLKLVTRPESPLDYAHKHVDNLQG